jgi:hypothetical protein
VTQKKKEIKGVDTVADDVRRSRRVEDSIYKRARGYKVAVKKTYKVKRVEYDPDTGKKTLEREELQTGIDEVHIPADVRAGEYWLKNRSPERWSEQPVILDPEEKSGLILLPDVDVPSESVGEDTDG